MSYRTYANSHHTEVFYKHKWVISSDFLSFLLNAVFLVSDILLFLKLTIFCKVTIQ